ncbi:hypothetical protein L2E82_18386 [Cichorium intybus]|uniref:Uncharacterized protein n=1 Tax=Cichorium intybus TaxID=13427 RepID=A0ACB9F9Z4_CICIN|nr:hypothetical protein L2E82_18386 [Cichorium intybus]
MFAIHEMLVAAKQDYVLNGRPIVDKTNRTRTNTTFLYIYFSRKPHASIGLSPIKEKNPLLSKTVKP